jgi:hypothetical protein
MSDSKAVKERIESLISEVPEVTRGDGYQQRAWLTAALNAVDLVCPSANNAYFVTARQIVTSPTMPPPHSLFEMAAMMTRLLEEIEGGLLTTIENHAIAATFDDFLGHGAEYLKHGRKTRSRRHRGHRVRGHDQAGLSRLGDPREPGSAGGTDRGTRQARCDH